MQEFDVLVIGGGAANKVASAASAEGLETALVEPGPLGGTCLNRGCNPSKMLIQHANALNAVRDAGRFHIDATVDGYDFAGLVDDVNSELGAIADGMAEDKRADPNLTLYEQYAAFVGDRTVELEDGTALRGEKVVVGAGSRPLVPPIDGLDEVDFITSTEAIRLDSPPEELVVLGGGYVAAELGYYFDAFGTDVTLIDMLDTLVPREDREIAEAFTDIARERHTVHVGYRVTAASQDGDRVSVTAENEAGEAVEASGDTLLVAAGRRPNTDTLAVEAGDIETDDRGIVVTDDQLRTSADDVWAQGDIADNAMFKHSVDHETAVTTANVVHGEGRTIDLRAMPHAVFTEPPAGRRRGHRGGAPGGRPGLRRRPGVVPGLDHGAGQAVRAGPREGAGRSRVRRDPRLSRPGLRGLDARPRGRARDADGRDRPGHRRRHLRPPVAVEDHPERVSGRGRLTAVGVTRTPPHGARAAPR